MDGFDGIGIAIGVCNLESLLQDGYLFVDG